MSKSNINAIKNNILSNDWFATKYNSLGELVGTTISFQSNDGHIVEVIHGKNNEIIEISHIRRLPDGKSIKSLLPSVQVEDEFDNASILMHAK